MSQTLILLELRLGSRRPTPRERPCPDGYRWDELAECACVPVDGEAVG